MSESVEKTPDSEKSEKTPDLEKSENLRKIVFWTENVLILTEKDSIWIWFKKYFLYFSDFLWRKDM